MNKIGFYLFAIFCCLNAASSGSSQEIPSDLTGDALARILRKRFSPTRTLSYKQARTLMFSDIDNVNGRVTLVYTGQSFQTSGIPNANFVNTEHTWPQSRFGSSSGSNAKKTDLHHLFPTFNRVNGARGNKPFADIADAVTSDWWISSTSQSTIPQSEIDDFSESTDDLFEPRESHKGNVARAMFYFFVIYGDRGIDKQWFEPQIPTMLRWHTLDPVDDTERARNEEIADAQGNRNPFVMDSGLPFRLFETDPGPLPDPGLDPIPNPGPEPRPTSITVAQALDLPNDGQQVTVRGTIVDGFNDPFGLRLADEEGEGSLVVQIPRRFRSEFNPTKNPDARGVEVFVKGRRRLYAHEAGLKSVDSITRLDRTAVEPARAGAASAHVNDMAIERRVIESAARDRLDASSARLDPSREGVFVRVVDVGAGLCCLVKVTDATGKSSYMVYDTGTYENEGFYGGQTVRGFVAFRQAQRLMPRNTEIDWLVHSHEDADHIAGTPLFCDYYKVKNFLRTGWVRRPRKATQNNALEAIRNEVRDDGARDWVQKDRNSRMPIGNQFNLGEATLTLLSGFGKPLGAWYDDFPRNRISKSKKRNSISIVLRLDYRGRCILFTGDAVGKLDGNRQTSVATEKFMLANDSGRRRLNADVLIAAHHGADNATSTRFLEAVTPRFVVFPAGSSHGHPRYKTVQRILDEGSTKFIFRTDLGDYYRSGGTWNWGSSNRGDEAGDDHVDIALTPSGRTYVYYSDPNKSGYSVAN